MQKTENLPGSNQFRINQAVYSERLEEFNRGMLKVIKIVNPRDGLQGA